MISVVAPSPSAACWRARSRATASMAPPRASAAGPAPTGAAPDAPEARRKTVSLVLVSPSIDSWSHVRAAAGRRRPDSTSGLTAASVRTTDSIVAMLGWIIPTPLAMPLTRTGRRPGRLVGQLDDGRRDLDDRIGRAQGLGGGREPRVARLEHPGQPVDPVPDRVDGQPRADDPGRQVERAGRTARRNAPASRDAMIAWSVSPTAPSPRWRSRWSRRSPRPSRSGRWRCATWPRDGSATGGRARPRTRSG